MGSITKSTDTIYRNIGVNRGAPRIYIDLLTLSDHGFVPGALYERLDDADSGKMLIKLSEDGDKKVCGKKKSFGQVSVIDINNHTIAEVFKEAGAVRIDLSCGFLEITIDHLYLKKKQREEAFNDAVAKRSVSEGTICVGGGMATLAMHDTFASHGIDMTTEWVIDREQRYLDLAFRNNRAITASTRIINCAIERLEPSLFTTVNLCQLSLPCTGQSLSGRTKNGISIAEQHVDAISLYGFFKSLEHINAGIYISENVPEAQFSATYILIKNVLVSLGYKISEFILDSSQSGSFENRRRYWFIAVSAGLKDLDHSLLKTYQRQYGTFSDFMDNVSDNDPSWSDNTYLKDKAVRDKQTGKGFTRQLIDGSTTGYGVVNRHYTKRQSTPPMVIRDSDDKERLLTVNEHALGKQCDPALVVDFPMTTAHEVLGQGIDMGQCKGLTEMLALNFF